jgi:flavin reductase (DIM6/NTAB) family NADH-FMN oxidoreductase RutF
MDPQIKKQTLRLFTYGMYVVTAAHQDAFAAGSVTWLSQASFEPPLIMVAVRKDSGLHGLVEASGSFAVNILAADQKEAASAFFRPTEVKDGKINGYAFESGPETGAPLLLELPAWCEARVSDAIKEGDHTVYVAEVINAGLRDPEAEAMVLRDTGWSYGG